MKPANPIVLAIVGCVFAASVAVADFDGSEPLVCSFGQVKECDHGTACRDVAHESVDAPDFVKLNFKKKELVSTTAGNDSGPEKMTVTDLSTFLVVQGVQGSGHGNSLAWSISIDQSSGEMVAAGAGEKAAFVIYGACTPL